MLLQLRAIRGNKFKLKLLTCAHGRHCFSSIPSTSPFNFEFKNIKYILPKSSIQHLDVSSSKFGTRLRGQGIHTRRVI